MVGRGYQEHEAREVALRAFILLPAEPPDEDDEQERELAAMEAEYQRNPPVVPDLDDDEWAQEMMQRGGPPATGQRGTEYSVPNSLPYILTEDPDPFDTVENLERHLAELQAMPAYQNKASHINRLKGVIAISKRHGAERKTMTKK